VEDLPCHNNETIRMIDMDKLNMEEVRGLLKVAGEQLRVSQEVIGQLAAQNEDLAHQVAARDLTIKLASAGRLPMGEMPEKVAELEQKSDQDLQLEQKLADMQEDRGHTLHRQPGAQGQDHGTGLMSFLQS